MVSWWRVNTNLSQIGSSLSMSINSMIMNRSIRNQVIINLLLSALHGSQWSMAVFKAEAVIRWIRIGGANTGSLQGRSLSWTDWPWKWNELVDEADAGSEPTFSGNKQCNETKELINYKQYLACGATAWRTCAISNNPCPTKHVSLRMMRPSSVSASGFTILVVHTNTHTVTHTHTHHLTVSITVSQITDIWHVTSAVNHQSSIINNNRQPYKSNTSS